IVISVNFTQNTTLSPQAERDTDTPDLGYHYPALDWAVGGIVITNCTLTLTNGVAVAVYDLDGLKLRAGGKLISEGRPLQLNRLVRYNAVQEQPTFWGATGASMSLVAFQDNASELTFRLTEVGQLANSTG